jgi:hypothetical protein
VGGDGSCTVSSGSDASYEQTIGVRTQAVETPTTADHVSGAAYNKEGQERKKRKNSKGNNSSDSLVVVEAAGGAPRAHRVCRRRAVGACKCPVLNRRVALGRVDSGREEQERVEPAAVGRASAVAAHLALAVRRLCRCRRFPRACATRCHGGAHAVWCCRWERRGELVDVALRERGALQVGRGAARRAFKLTRGTASRARCALAVCVQRARARLELCRPALRSTRLARNIGVPSTVGADERLDSAARTARCAHAVGGCRGWRCFKLVGCAHCHVCAREICRDHARSRDERVG